MKQEARIRTLVARYDEGLTSPDEEQELKRLLSAEEELPRDLKSLTLMLGGLEELGEELLPARLDRPTASSRRTWWQWAMAAAAVVAIALIVDYQRTPYCYIDGIAIYDPEEALASTDCLAQLEQLDQSMAFFDTLITND